MFTGVLGKAMFTGYSGKATLATDDVEVSVDVALGMGGPWWGGRWWGGEFWAPAEARRDLEAIYLGVPVTLLLIDGREAKVHIHELQVDASTGHVSGDLAGAGPPPGA